MSWAELHVDLLEEISKRLTVADYIRFRAVCLPWHSAVGRRPHHLPRQLPWLMLENKVKSHEEDSDGEDTDYGWLALVGMSPSVRLLNPLTGEEVLLPPMTTLPWVLEFYPLAYLEEYVLTTGHLCLEDAKDKIIEKIVMSSDPTSNGDCVVLAYSYMFKALFFCKPGDQTWIVVEGSKGDYWDIVFYKGRFVAINETGEFSIIELGPSLSVRFVGICDRSSSKGAINSSVFIKRRFGVRLYLVELAGELLVLVRYIRVDGHDHDIPLYRTFYFDAYKVAFDTNSVPVKLSKVEGFGKYALFVGAKNTSLSSSIEGNDMFYENSICFTEDYMCGREYAFSYRSHQMGIYPMEKNASISYRCDRRFIWPAPAWITPSLC